PPGGGPPGPMSPPGGGPPGPPGPPGPSSNVSLIITYLLESNV
ncbi:MAG TPA: collagen-like protein, partial [Alphaproteobacteria bacterium]|nr:collagen-like protein [Alphaproteobacteria bacterium]